MSLNMRNIIPQMKLSQEEIKMKMAQRGAGDIHWQKQEQRAGLENRQACASW